MGETKKIVCLANSRKHSGRCVAGKEVLEDGFGAWIRPVSARQSAEISEEERRYENGALPKVLDIIDIPMIGAAPLLHQSENYLIDSARYWVKTGEASWSDVQRLVDKPSTLWTDGDSTYYGLNDRVKVATACKLTNSLMLISPQELALKVVTEGREFGNPRRRVRADFRHAGVNYSLVVTDPVAEGALLAKPDAQYQLEDTYLCVSLGEAHTDGWCYKLVAAVISEDPLWGP
jgi:hypothetical protein